MRTWKTEIKGMRVNFAVTFDCANGQRAFIESSMQIESLRTKGGSLALKNEADELIKRFCENNNTNEV